MTTYSTVRNTGLATIVVAVLAGALSNGVTANQRIVFERDLPEAAAVAALPEIEVSATRLPL